jgi:membrane associated rhomboid family serine protease
MDQTRYPGGHADPSPEGPQSRADAEALLQRANELLRAGDFNDAARHYVSILRAPMGDPQISAAALLGLGEARYRTDDDEGALANWLSITKLPETSSTYAAWRQVAAAQVRAGDLRSAFDSYKEADRRAPDQDKAEIASRLGWLSKELGDQGGANRYFAKARGDALTITMTKVIIAVTVVISLTAMLTADGPDGPIVYQALWLDKALVAAGEYWRLWTVTLVHAPENIFHLVFNMWALWIVGPLVERWYGQIRFLVFYLACAATGSVASFVFGGAGVSVGASGAIFGMFGVIAAASWIHKPVDRQARAIAMQIGVLILINLAFGFASGGAIDNAAHIGGLLGGLWLGAAIPPTRVPTMSSWWRQAGPSGTMDRIARPPTAVPVLAVGVLVVSVVVGVMYGTSAYDDGGAPGLDLPAVISPAIVAPSSD